MNDDGWQRDEVQSPCTKICVIHPSAGVCVGCFRTMEEIAGWTRLSADQRRAVLSDLPGRETVLYRRRGGHTGRRRQVPE